MDHYQLRAEPRSPLWFLAYPFQNFSLDSLPLSLQTETRSNWRFRQLFKKHNLSLKGSIQRGFVKDWTIGLETVDRVKRLIFRPKTGRTFFKNRIAVR